MATHVVHSSDFAPYSDVRPIRSSDAIRFLVPLGRVMFCAPFLMFVPGHFTHRGIEHAAAAGVPMASVLVPLAGVIALLGGLSVALGFMTRIGAALLVLFLVPVTIMMHRFWGVDDPQTALLQQIMFMKNIAMLGGALLIGYFGAGPISFDERGIGTR